MPAWPQLFVCAVLSVVTVTAAHAQESRAGEIAAAQAAKAAKLHPYELTRLEKILSRIERSQVDPPPFAVLLDSVYSGGGFTPGARYRRPFGDRAALLMTGLYSFKNYKLVEAVTTSPGHARDHLDLTARAGWRDATQVGFYGLGPDSAKSDRANYRFKQTFVEGAATFRPVRWLPIEGRLGFEDFQLLSGKGDEPSIETVYTPETAPGLGDSASFAHAQIQAAIDTRPWPGYAREGGLYEVAFHRYADTGETYSFDRVDVTAMQHIPVLRETWVVSLRARLLTTVSDDSVVPYFMLPALGGGRSLRAYSSWRFRDRHAALGTIEWRWIPNRLGLDLAIFYDAGTVAARRGDLSVDRITSNWGVGARFHGPRTTPVRIELAKGAEGWHVVFSSSAAF